MVLCNNEIEIDSYVCESEDNTKKYCNPLTATCVENETCPTIAELVCERSGFFPHVVEPNSFVYCQKAGSTGRDYNCPIEYMYDSMQNICTKNKVPFVSFTSNGLCKEKLLQYVTHTNDPSIYTLCSKLSKKIIVNMCPSKDQIFDVETHKCVLNCPYEGFFPNPSNENEYCICYRGENGLRADCAPCKNNGKFQDPKKFCV